MSYKTKKSIPKQLYGLFWDYDPQTLDVDLHKDLIIGRITEIGTWHSMKWLLKAYSKNEILSFLYNKGKKTLPLRELNYWLLIMGVSSKAREQILNQANESNHVWKNRYSH